MELGKKDSLYLLNTNRRIFKYIPEELTSWEIYKLLNYLISKRRKNEYRNILNDLFLGLLVDQTTGCWYIKNRKNKYRQITTDNKKNVIAHRLAYELFIGVILLPIVCHHCDCPGCCNPWHLFNGTYKDNIEDAKLKGRLKRKLNLTDAEKFLLWKHINSSSKHTQSPEIEITGRAKDADKIFGII